MRNFWGRTAVLLLASAFVASGCSKLTATMLGVSITTATPDLTEAEGFEGALAAALSVDDPQLSGAAAVAVALFERESATSTDGSPKSGADVTLNYDGEEVEVCEGEAGAYLATSIPGDCQDELLEYIPGEDYTTIIVTGDDEYSVSVLAPEPIDAADVVFDPPLDPDGGPGNMPSHVALADLDVDWSGDSQASERNSFVTLFRINYEGAGDPYNDLDANNWVADIDNPIADTSPRTGDDIVAFVTQSPATAATIEGDFFDATGLYMLVITSTEISTDSSDNLSLGSAALAGKGTAFLFYVD